MRWKSAVIAQCPFGRAPDAAAHPTARSGLRHDTGSFEARGARFRSVCAAGAARAASAWSPMTPKNARLAACSVARLRPRLAPRLGNPGRQGRGLRRAKRPSASGFGAGRAGSAAASGTASARLRDRAVAVQRRVELVDGLVCSGSASRAPARSRRDVGGSAGRVSCTKGLASCGVVARARPPRPTTLSPGTPIGAAGRGDARRGQEQQGAASGLVVGCSNGMAGSGGVEEFSLS